MYSADVRHKGVPDPNPTASSGAWSGYSNCDAGVRQPPTASNGESGESSEGNRNTQCYIISNLDSHVFSFCVCLCLFVLIANRTVLSSYTGKISTNLQSLFNLGNLMK